MEYCLATGCPHPDFIFQRLTWEQWLDWLAYYEQHTFGDRRADARMSVLFWAAVAPWSSEITEAPKPVWPYWEDDAAAWDELEVTAQTAGLLAYRKVLQDGQANLN